MEVDHSKNIHSVSKNKRYFENFIFNEKNIEIIANVFVVSIILLYNLLI